MMASSSGPESSSSEALYTLHNLILRSLTYEIGRIYYIDDKDDSYKHNTHIFADLTESNGVQMAIKDDTGVQDECTAKTYL